MNASEQIMFRGFTPFQNFNTEGEESVTVGVTVQSLTQRKISCKMIYLRAPTTNTGTIYIGSNKVTATNAAIALAPGEEIALTINNTMGIFVISDTATQVVNYVACI